MTDNVNKQVRWFDHQFVRAADFQAEQDFANDRRARHNSGFHTPGVVEGLEPSWADGAHTLVNFTPGWVVDGDGNEMIVLPPGPGSVAVATDTAVWIQAQRTPSDPSTDPGTAKPGGGGNEETRWDETPKVFAAPANPRPAGAVLLATIAGGTLTDAREMAGLGGRDIVLSKDIKPADPGTDQDTTTGAGVKTGHIKDAAIIASKLAPASVTTPAIGVNQVTSEELAHDGARDALRAVGTDHIKDGAVSPAKLQPGVPYPFTPGDGSVRSPTIAVADNSGSQDPTTGVGVKSPHIQNGAITSGHIQGGAVQLPQLDPHLGLDTNRIGDGQVTLAKLAPNLGLDTNRIGDHQVTLAKLDPNLGLTTQMIGFGAVDRNRLFPDVQSALPKAWCQVQVNQGVASFFERYHVPSATGDLSHAGRLTITWDGTVVGFGQRTFLLYASALQGAVPLPPDVPPFAASFVSWATLNNGAVTGINIQLYRLQSLQVQAFDGLVNAVFF